MKRVKIYIDGHPVETDGQTKISMSMDKDKFTSMSGHSSAVSWSDISIPATPSNCSALNFPNEIYSSEIFNNSLHSLTIIADESTLFEGYAKLLRYESGDAEGRFVIRPVILDKDWLNQMGAKTIASLYDTYSITAGGDAIIDSWDDTPLVKFLPVARDTETADVSGTVVERLSTADYHPFLHIPTVLQAIFKDAGYTVSSSLLSDTLFKTLYMSGSYSETDNITTLKKSMDFLAGRFANTTTTANYLGRVYFNPYMMSNSVGNIVDTANPNEISEGQTIAGVYDNGGCFTKQSSYIRFVPKKSVTVSFEYFLHYTSGYRIKSRTELAGFNKITLGYNDSCEITIPNKFPDLRDSFQSGTSYRCIVFDYTSGQEFRLMGRCIIGNLAYNNITISDFSARSALVSATLSGTYSNLKLYAKNSGGVYFEYTADWALYYGILDETGTTEVSVTVTSRPENLSPSSPKSFYSIMLEGAEQGMSFTLHSDTTVRPKFLPHPIEGTTLGFSDLLPRTTKRADLLKALEHMYCLRFFADTRKKIIYIEPDLADSSSELLYLTSKIDTSRPLQLQEPDYSADSLTLRYLSSASGAVSRRDDEEDSVLGEYYFELSKPYASTENETNVNPLFAPSLCVKGVHSSTPSALAISVGDKDSDTESFNFDTRVVSWRGLTALPTGETWDWPSYGSEYPLAAFVLTASTADTSGLSSSDRCSLCFEDHDSIKGLRKYWEERLSRYTQGRQMTLYLKLSPFDIERLLFDGDSWRRTDRCMFRIGSENSIWRLEKIVGYNPEEASVKCVFVRAV